MKEILFLKSWGCVGAALALLPPQGEQEAVVDSLRGMAWAIGTLINFLIER